MIGYSLKSNKIHLFIYQLQNGDGKTIFHQYYFRGFWFKLCTFSFKHKCTSKTHAKNYTSNFKAYQINTHTYFFSHSYYNFLQFDLFDIFLRIRFSHLSIFLFFASTNTNCYAVHQISFVNWQFFH